MELFTEFRKYGFIYELRLSVALDISYSLLSTAELRGEILMHVGCFGFH